MYGRGVCAGFTLQSAALVQTNLTEWSEGSAHLAVVAVVVKPEPLRDDRLGDLGLLPDGDLRVAVGETVI